MAARQPTKYVHGLNQHQTLRAFQFKRIFGFEVKAMLCTAINTYFDLLEERKNYPKKNLTLAVVDESTGKVAKWIR